MPKRSIQNFLLIVLLTCFYIKATAQNIQVEAKLDRVSIPIGDQTILHVSARMPVKTDITFPVIADSIGKVQIVKSLKADTVIYKSDPSHQTITHNYAITSFDAGVYTFPAFIFHTKTGDLETGTPTLQVKAIPVDTTKTFYDIKQPLTISYTFWDWLKDHWLAVLLGLAAVLVIAGLVYYYKKRPKMEVPVAAAAGPVLSADTISLNKLNELRAKNLWQQGEVKLYYSELSDVMREYLEKRFHIQAHEQTTDEIFENLTNKDLEAESKTALRQILTLADLVKFAKHKPEAFDNEQSMEKAVSFIMQTKHQPQPQTDKKEDLSK